VADLSQPVPGTAGCFDAVASYLILNDVTDYHGFAATLAAALKPGGKTVLAFNNSYSAVTDRHVADYFNSGAAAPTAACGAGIKTYHYRRTLENYLDAFLATGLRLAKLADIRPWPMPTGQMPAPHRSPLPRFMLLAFIKP
jgi:hypothetical protein